jgi:thiol-disulfide isomerase/thioredoxin
MTSGVIALIVALALAIAAGVVWRRGNGRMRSAGGRGHGQDARPDGDVTTSAAAEPAGAAVLTGEQLGGALGERATLVQFSSAFCAPCRATRRILADVAAMTDGVTHIEIDAESRLDLVRRLNVLRTPTVLVTDAAGRVVKRASGQPRKADVIAAIGQAVANGIPGVPPGGVPAGPPDGLPDGLPGVPDGLPGGPALSIPTYLIGKEDSDSSTRRA